MSGLFSTPASQVQAPTLQQVYQPQGMGQADTGALQGISGLSGYNTWGNLYPQASGISQNLISSPGAGQYLAGAGQAGQMGQAGAMGAYGQGQNLYNMGGALAQTAFDPQSALYGRTAQQVQDQTRAANEAAGVGTSPYGAGIEAQAMSNFNIDWQNQQLQRQLQGIQGAGSAIGQGAGLQAAAPGQYLQAAGMPYSTYQGIGQQQLGTLGQQAGFGAQGAQIPQMTIQDYLSYMGGGTSAAQAQNAGQLGLYSGELQQANLEGQQQSAMFGGLGKMLGGIAGLGMTGGGTVGGNILGSAFPSWFGTSK